MTNSEREPTIEDASSPPAAEGSGRVAIGEREHVEERPHSEAPSTSATPVWVVVELPEEELGGAFSDKISRAGFKSQLHHPSIFLRHAVIEPEALALMLEALVGRGGAPGAKMTLLNGLGEPSLTEILTQLEPLQQFLSRLKSQWLMPYIVARRVFPQLQPVFNAKGAVVAQDALARLGNSQSQATGLDIVRAAAELDLGALIDRLVRLEAFNAATGGDTALILHLSTATLRSPQQLKSSLIELARVHRVELSKVVLSASWETCQEATSVGRAFFELRSLGVRYSVGGGVRTAEFSSVEHVIGLARSLDATNVRMPYAGGAPFAFDPGVFEAVCAQAPDVGLSVHATRLASVAELEAAKRAGAEFFSGRVLSR
jgi:EAL domain-containing protein (putative c-di-GMP-specific phosphodiesterase class I)